MKILKVESTLPDGSKVVFDRESSKKEWDKIRKKFEKTLHELKPPKDFDSFASTLSNLNTISDEMLTFIRKDKLLKNVTTTALFVIMLKSMQDPSAMNEWLNQEQKNWTDPKILQERIKNIEDLDMEQKGDRT